MSLAKWMTQHAKRPTSPTFVMAAIANFLRRVGLEDFGRQTAERITALESRIVALESLPLRLTYLGVWNDGEPYAANSVVTRDGSMWVSLTNENRSRPGSAHSGWQLAVKRGSNGRDGKDAQQ